MLLGMPVGTRVVRTDVWLAERIASAYASLESYLLKPALPLVIAAPELGGNTCGAVRAAQIEDSNRMGSARFVRGLTGRRDALSGM